MVKNLIQSIFKMSSNKKKKVYADITFLREAANDDLNFLFDMIKVFSEESKIYLQKLKELYLEERWSDFSEVSHKMKTTMMVVGINSIGEELEQMEVYARQKQYLDELPMLILKVAKACREGEKELTKQLSDLCHARIG